jgi:rhodanese-related sulfurtransferase
MQITPLRTLREAGYLLLLTLALGLAANALRPDGLPLFKVLRQTPGTLPYATLSPLAAADLLRQGKAVFVDARAAKYFALAHVPGALNITPEQAQAGAADGLPRDKTIVVYCDSLACGLSHAVAHALADKGLTVAVMQDGIEGWIMTRGPLEVSQ